MNRVTCHRLRPILEEPAFMDVNVICHHVLQQDPEPVVGELVIVQIAYCFCSSLACFNLVIFLQLYLALLIFF